MKKLTKIVGQLMMWRSGYGCELVEYIEENNDPVNGKLRVNILSGELFSWMIAVFPPHQLSDTTKEIFERYKRRYSQ